MTHRFFSDRIHPEPSAAQSVSRRTFLKGAAASGLGLLAIEQKREAIAALLSGKQPPDVQGVGVPKGIVRLAFNENPIGASPKAIQAVLQHQDWMNRYDYTNDLLAALVTLHQLDIPRVSGFDFKAAGEKHGIILGVGTTELLQLLALAALMPNGETIEAFPSYGQITRVGDELKEAGFPVNAKKVPLRPDGRHDLDGMRNAITDKTTLVIIANPHNPTGTLLAHDEIVRFVDNVPPRVLVVIDEVYIHFVRERGYQDFIPLAKERENVIVLRTFSKVYGLGGMRVGYGVAHPKVIKRLAPFAMGLLSRNTLSIFAAVAALGDTEHVRRSQQTVWDGNDYLVKELQTMGFSAFPSHANFLMIDLKQDTTKIVRQLGAKNVLVRAGGGQWGMPTHIRVSTGTMDENEAFIGALRGILA